MRTTRLLLTLALAALLATPLALAEEGKGRSDQARADQNPDHDDDRAEHRDQTRAARENFTANRSALMERFLDRLHALHGSWQENATAIRETCRNATQVDHANETKENRTAWAHCVRDGYHEWRAEKRAELKELRAELRALFEGWHKSRRSSD